MADQLIADLHNEGLISDATASAAEADNSFGDEGAVWIDADTIRMPDGKSTVRLRGYNALEVDKLRSDEDDRPYIKGGEIGGLEQTATISRLAREHGFTNLVDTGEKGAHGRPIYDLQNAAGTSFGDMLHETGVVDPTKYAPKDTSEQIALNKLWRSTDEATNQPDEFHMAGEQLREFIEEQSPGERLKQIAFDEQEAAGAAEAAKKFGVANPFYDDTVQVRNHDRKYDNKALNPLSTAWDAGWQGVIEGGAGMLELIGHETGWEGLEEYGEAIKDQKQYDLSKAPQIILDYKEIDDTGDFIEYVGNMAAMSLPYMAITVGGALLAPATGGLSLAAPASVYAGQTWNEMGDTDEDEKNAALAIGAGISMAVLDRLGIQGIANTSVLSAAGRKAATAELVKKGMTEEAAKAALVGATRREAAHFAGDAVAFAKRELQASQVLKQLLKTGAISSSVEAGTEMAQETVGYLAAVAGSDKLFSAEELTNRLTNAAIGGGVLGGAFSVPGTAYNTGAWADVAYRLAPADINKQTQQNQWAEEERKQHGRVRSHEELLKDADVKENQRRNKGKYSKTLKQRADADTERTGERGLKGTMLEMWEGIPGFWRGSTRFFFSDDIQQRSPTARGMASIFGGQLTQMHSGATYENSKHLKLAEYKNMVDSPDVTVSHFLGEGTKPTRQNMQAVSDVIYGAYDKVGTDFDKLKGDPVYDKYIPALKAYNKAAQRMTDKAFQDQQARGAKINKLTDYAYRHRSLDKVAVEDNPTAFKQDLMKEYKMPEQEAQKIVDEVLNNDSFTLAQGSGFKPASHKGRTLNLSDNPVFKSKWLDQNVFNNLSDIAKTAARYNTYQDFLGSGDGNHVDSAKKVESMLTDVEEELLASGMDEKQAADTANKLGRQMRDYFDAESGNYKRPTTPFGRAAIEMQKNVMFYTTLSSLPLATFSSMIELALTSRSLDKQQVGQLAKIAREEAAEIKKNWWHDRDETTKGRKVLRDLGFFEWEVGAATVTGVTETKRGKAEMLDRFFRLIGLKQFTDYTRALRGSIAADYIMDKLEIVASRDLDNLTNEDVEAADALRNLGLNVEEMIDAYHETERTPEQEAKLDQDLRTASFNFINDAIVLPQTANRPLFYNDPRFALFTQFHGFISAFQSNHLPKLYRQAFKGQTPSMKYNAFAVMATMIMLGFVSQHLKDLIKYGQATPYLTDNDEYIRRAIGATGLLGVGERGLELVNPIYEQRHSGPLDWAFNSVVGESAAASKLQGTLGDLGHAISGDPNRATKGLLKWAPGGGPLTEGRQQIADWLFEPEE